MGTLTHIHVLQACVLPVYLRIPALCASVRVCVGVRLRVSVCVSVHVSVCMQLEAPCVYAIGGNREVGAWPRRLVVESLTRDGVVVSPP